MTCEDHRNHPRPIHLSTTLTLSGAHPLPSLTGWVDMSCSSSVILSPAYPISVLDLLSLSLGSDGGGRLSLVSAVLIVPKRHQPGSGGRVTMVTGPASVSLCPACPLIPVMDADNQRHGNLLLINIVLFPQIIYLAWAASDPSSDRNG